MARCLGLKVAAFTPTGSIVSPSCPGPNTNSNTGWSIDGLIALSPSSRVGEQGERFIVFLGERALLGAVFRVAGRRADLPRRA